MTLLEVAHGAADTGTSKKRAVRHRPGSGLNYQVAHNLLEVLEGWLVHHAYVRAGLIHPNVHGVHTVREAAGPQTAVILGRIEPVAASTMSGYQDSPAGLPLDSVYNDELNILRDRGRRMMEVGLFADRREHMNRSVDSLFDLMRYLFFYAWHSNCTDVVIGVHPRHARFYTAFLAFAQEGPEKSYATVNHNPVVFLRMDIREVVKLDPLPRGLAYFLENPVPAEAYQQRYTFDAENIANSCIGTFLRSKDNEQIMAETSSNANGAAVPSAIGGLSKPRPETS